MAALGTFATSVIDASESAFGGKPENIYSLRALPVLTLSGMGEVRIPTRTMRGHQSSFGTRWAYAASNAALSVPA